MKLFRCDKSYIKFSETNKEEVFCGTRQASGSFTFLSCTNSVTISYVSSSNAGLFYRGVNVYYEGKVALTSKSTQLNR